MCYCTVFAIYGQFPSMPPGAWRGNFCVTSLGLILGAGLYMEGLIFGILRYTVLERRSGKIEQNLNFVARGGGGVQELKMMVILLWRQTFFIAKPHHILLIKLMCSFQI